MNVPKSLMTLAKRGKILLATRYLFRYIWIVGNLAFWAFLSKITQRIFCKGVHLDYDVHLFEKR